MFEYFTELVSVRAGVKPAEGDPFLFLFKIRSLSLSLISIFGLDVVSRYSLTSLNILLCCLVT